MTARERCMAYLLGEMNDHQTAAFEAELVDPALSEALLRESNLLVRVATDESFAVGDKLELARPLSSPSPSARPTTRSIVILISSLAATILIVSFYSFSHQVKTTSQTVQAGNAPSPASFELALAMTWVDPAIDWISDDQEDFVAPDNDNGYRSLDDTDTEETLEWMVAAVQASIQGGENNDG